MRNFMILLATVLSLAMLAAVDASARGRGHGGWHGGGHAGWHGGGWHGGGRRYYGGGYYGGGGYYNGGNVAGAAIAGGILGLATGAIIAGSAANAAAPPAGVGDPNWVAYCARKYKSFDPATGTFLSYDGQRYLCQ